MASVPRSDPCTVTVLYIISLWLRWKITLHEEFSHGTTVSAGLQIELRLDLLKVCRGRLLLENAEISFSVQMIPHESNMCQKFLILLATVLHMLTDMWKVRSHIPQPELPVTYSFSSFVIQRKFGYSVSQFGLCVCLWDFEEASIRNPSICLRFSCTDSEICPNRDG